MSEFEKLYDEWGLTKKQKEVTRFRARGASWQTVADELGMTNSSQAYNINKGVQAKVAKYYGLTI